MAAWGKGGGGGGWAGWGKGGGNGGGGGGWGKKKNGAAAEAQVPAGPYDPGYPGLTEALAEVLAPHAALDTEWTLEEMQKKIAQKFTKAGSKFWKDERFTARGTASLAKVVVEDFVETVLSSISTSCYDKAWLGQVDFGPPLKIATMYVFATAKVVSRTLAPQMDALVEEAIFKWQEEQRIEQAIWDSVAAAGVHETHLKKARQHLSKAYDEAHFKAPYGTSDAASHEEQLLKDFTRGWIVEFLGKAWDVLESGTTATSRDEQVLFLTVLFQSLTDPANCCIPQDIVNTLATGMPAHPWPFVAEAVEAAFTAAEPVAGAPTGEPMAKRRNVGKQGGGKGW